MMLRRVLDFLSILTTRLGGEEPVTAAELMKSLERDEKYQAMRRAQQSRMNAFEALLSQDELELVAELNDSGCHVTSVWDLVCRENDYHHALPILKKHLEMGHHPRILGGLLRALAVAEFSDDDGLWNRIVSIYAETPSDSEIDDPGNRGVRKAAAIALEILAKESRLPELLRLLDQNPKEEATLFLKGAIKRISPRFSLKRVLS